jgi:integrase
VQGQDDSGHDLPPADGRRRQVMRRRDENGQHWLTREDAANALREAVVKVRKGNWIEPSRQPLGEYLQTWLGGLRLAPSTTASYRKNVRLHVEPYIGAVPLASLMSARLSALYRELETSGRRDQEGRRTGLPLSARTVRYVHEIFSAALDAALQDEVPLLERNPAVKAKPPTAREARAPEMHPWDASQLGAFLAWSADQSPLHAPWLVLAMTGMRRGELLALRWRDIDLDAGTIAVRRSVGVVKHRGQPEQLVEGSTKTCRPRVIDIDPATTAVLRAWKSERGAIGLHLARGSAVMFGNREAASVTRRPSPSCSARHRSAAPARSRGRAAQAPAARPEAYPRDAAAARSREPEHGQRAARARQRVRHAECLHSRPAG